MKYKGMVSPDNLQDTKLRTVLGPMFINLSILTGLTTGSNVINNRATTVQDLVDLGFLAVVDGRLVNATLPDAQGFNSFDEREETPSEKLNFSFDTTDNATGNAIRVIVDNGTCRLE